MLCVGEHIDGLYLRHFVFVGKELQITSLGGRIAADVDNLRRFGGEQLLNHFFVHSCTGRIGDDHIGASVKGDKFGGQHFGHITGIELGVVETVVLGVDFGVGDGLFDILDADDSFALSGKEEGDGARAGIYR